MNRPTLNIHISSELQLSHGVLLTITENEITLSQPGPNGGKGDRIVIKASDWLAVVQAVGQVQTAIARANVAINDVMKEGENADGNSQDQGLVREPSL